MSNELDETTEAINRLVAITDPLDLNEAAALLGIGYARLKNEASDKEAHRTVLRARIEKRLRDSGEAKSDKEAERMAKETEQYTAYCEDLSKLELRGDMAEVLYKAAHQRAWLLGNNPVQAGT